jgi:CheY-like chemotaxis protein
MMRVAVDGEQHADRLRDDFRDDAKARIGAMAYLIDAADERDGAADTIALLRRQTRELKALASVSGYPMVSMIAHRLEDYLADLREINARARRDMGRFVSLLQSAVGRGINPEESEMGQLVRSLPMRRNGADTDDSPSSSAEILLVTTSNVVRMLVERELKGRGYRVVVARSPFEAFELAYRMKPDLLLVSNTMNGPGGPDLVRAFAAMSATRTMAAAVLTSMDGGNVSLRDLAPRVPTVRLGRYFTEDFARVAERFQLG